jgi:hypothetical protein
MYTNTTDYETYTGTTAPVDYTRQELYATVLFKSLYPNFPSETQFAELDADTTAMIEYAIFEQIASGISYSGTAGQAQNFSVGNFSITEGSDSANDKLSFMALSYLQAAGVTFKGVGSC